ncbi:hypothetical protein NLJ89_g6648 [Agrocybe chaxingu]|uniref:Transposase n=1 Tax=Agrocybe chaxingu TaxID=84603 RepID=A0A9W8JW29_9AGAR|nr:hypothetical protein NLJ89_g6648 [Agrocybe chaxingu]
MGRTKRSSAKKHGKRPRRKEYCHCNPWCQEKLTRRTIRRHWKGRSDFASHPAAQDFMDDDDDVDIGLCEDDNRYEQELSEEEYMLNEAEAEETNAYLFSDDKGQFGSNDEISAASGEDDSLSESRRSYQHEYTSTPPSSLAADDDLQIFKTIDNDFHGGSESSDNSDSIASSPSAGSEGSHNKEYNIWSTFNETEDEADLDVGLQMETIEDMLNDDEYKEDWENRLSELSEEDHDNIRAFKLLMVSKMPRIAFKQMRFAFQHKLDISSHYVILHRLAVLSRVVPIWQDCCVNSCMAYTKNASDDEFCSYCGEDRWNDVKKPRRMFCYIPMIPRLQRMFSDPETCDRLMYRHEYKISKDTISDVFDSRHYQNLCRSYVTVNGKQFSYKYFSDKHDLALSICFDSYLLYKRRRGGPSATPILIQIYNLPPEIRTHIARLICLGVIPGPHFPKDISSFLELLDDELEKLAIGVKTFDCVMALFFLLRAYVILKTGDMVAINHSQNIKGHNAIFPCRGCWIEAVNNPNSKNKTYYAPLTRPDGEQSVDPYNLPWRKHTDWASITARITRATTEKERKHIMMSTGIKGMPTLNRVGSIDFARAVPWDYMHLLLENVVKNLFYLWQGRFKGLDDGVEDYIIPEHIWEEIGQETEAAVAHIPADFVRLIPNVFTNASDMTAEGWSFWFMYMAPILLCGRFRREKYYQHMMDLVNIMKICMQFSITHDEIDDLEDRIVKWVEEYEKIYYQYDIDRLSTCTLTIHGLLHIPDNIRFCGPVWTAWTFFMERYCGYLQAGLQSKTHPWSNLNNRVLHKAYLEQIDIYYGLKNDLDLTSGELSQVETMFPECEYVSD